MASILFLEIAQIAANWALLSKVKNANSAQIANVKPCHHSLYTDTEETQDFLREETRQQSSLPW